MRFLLIDRILELERGKRATGIKNVTLSEDFLEHHFPHSPVMPGALIVEAMVQLARWIVLENSGFHRTALVSTFDKLKFHRIVRPGDQLRIETAMLGPIAATAAVKAKAHCGGKLVAAAAFLLTCTDSEPLHSPEHARDLFDMITQPPGPGE